MNGQEESKNNKCFIIVEMFDCTMESIYIQNPNNEEKILNACMRGQSKPESCLSGEYDSVNQTLCMETIHTILMSYEEELKHSKSFGFPKLLDTANEVIQALKIDSKTVVEAPDKPAESYSKNVKQCKFLLIFQQLSATIHRIINYRKSLEKNAGVKTIIQGFF